MNPGTAPIVVTGTEICGLLAVAGPGAVPARERLGLGDADPESEQAGQVSLLSRGYLRRDETGLTPQGPGAVMATVLGADDGRWIRIVQGAPTGVSGSLLVDTAAASLGVDPRADRTFALTALPPGYSGNSVLGAAVLPYLDRRAPGIVDVVVWQAGREACLTLSRDLHGVWWRHDLGSEPVSTTRSAAATALGGLTAAWP